MYIVFILIAVVLIYVWAKSQKDPWVAFVKHRAANPLAGSSVLVDKIKVKEVVNGMGVHVLKTYAVVGDPEQINEGLLQQLPRKYIMKTQQWIWNVLYTRQVYYTRRSTCKGAEMDEVQRRWSVFRNAIRGGGKQNNVRRVAT